MYGGGVGGYGGAVGSPQQWLAPLNLSGETKMCGNGIEVLAEME